MHEDLIDQWSSNFLPHEQIEWGSVHLWARSSQAWRDLLLPWSGMGRKPSPNPAMQGKSAWLSPDPVVCREWGMA